MRHSSQIPDRTTFWTFRENDSRRPVPVKPYRLKCLLCTSKNLSH
ncbi:MAG: hypothetical protein Q8Q40_10020 [Methylococcaceae bacterium]|nr:hypothetical protein [Methylococcaceae bacterium]MDP3904300.1 hypothetical protein [Methylococcaceae bacterium]